MSRLAKKPISITKGVTVAKDGGVLVFKGPKGEIRLPVPAELDFRIEGENLWVDWKGGARNSAQGTFWSHAKNAIEGVSSGFSKVLEIEGVGYRAQVEGKNLVLFLGYAEPVKFPIAEGVAVAVDKNTITVSGIIKELVGQVAAKIRAHKKPEPYKGKGIHYRGEVIRRKVGKKAGTTTA